MRIVKSFMIGRWQGPWKRNGHIWYKKFILLKNVQFSPQKRTHLYFFPSGNSFLLPLPIQIIRLQNKHITEQFLSKNTFFKCWPVQGRSFLGSAAVNGKVYSIGGCLSEEFSTTEVRFIKILEAALVKSFQLLMLDV